MTNEELISKLSSDFSFFEKTIKNMEKKGDYELLHYKVNNKEFLPLVLHEVATGNHERKLEFFLTSSGKVLKSMFSLLHRFNEPEFSVETWDYIFSENSFFEESKIDLYRTTYAEKHIEELRKKKCSTSNVKEYHPLVLIALYQGYLIKSEDILSISDGINTLAHYYAIKGHKIESPDILKLRNRYRIPVASYVAEHRHEVHEDCLFIHGGYSEWNYDIIIENKWDLSQSEKACPAVISYVHGFNPSDEVLRKIEKMKDESEYHFIHRMSKSNPSKNELLYQPDDKSVAFEKALTQNATFTDRDIYSDRSSDGFTVAHAMASQGNIVNDKDFLLLETNKGETVVELFVSSQCNNPEILSKLDTSLIPEEILNRRRFSYSSISHILQLESAPNELKEEVGIEYI